MKKFFLAFAVLAAGTARAGDPCQDRPSLEEAAARGDAKAEYWLSSQLERGLCGPKDHARVDALLQQAASQDFPPAIQLLGVIARRDGRDAEALSYFKRAAGFGFQIAVADVGFTYGQTGSPVLDPALSYAWLSLAISREPTEGPRQSLESSRAKLMKAMSHSELAKGKSAFAELQNRFANIPVWVDHP